MFSFFKTHNFKYIYIFQYVWFLNNNNNNNNLFLYFWKMLHFFKIIKLN